LRRWHDETRRQVWAAKREDGYYVVEIHEDAGDCGPYDTKAIAEEHRRRLQRTLDHIDDQSFFTCEK
jgi:hypothetical protein